VVLRRRRAPLGGLWKGGDVQVIDGVGQRLGAAGRLVRRRCAPVAVRHIYQYAFTMIIGVFVLLTWFGDPLRPRTRR
jgi:NADH-quinone oxidoreductase subunit L